MQYGGQALYSEYGKFLFKQQAYMENHEVANLYGIDISTMHALSLTGIPGVVSVKISHTNKQTGHWEILMLSALTQEAIRAIDAQIQVQPQYFPEVRPNRQRKPI